MSRWCWKPALRMAASRLGYFEMRLYLEFILVIIRVIRGLAKVRCIIVENLMMRTSLKTYEVVHSSNFSIWPISKHSAATLSFPNLSTNSSKRSCLLPTAITKEPWLMIFSARAWPMPDVAPVTRTHL